MTKFLHVIKFWRPLQPVLITVPFVTRHMVIQGCFKTTSSDSNYWYSVLQLTLLALLFLHCFFLVHFSQHSLPKKCTLFFCQPMIQKKPFLPLFPLLRFFTFLNELCQLFIQKELNHPANPVTLHPWFYQGKGIYCA